jgi:transcriptional regulator with XRE-family HTH domain
MVVCNNHKVLKQHVEYFKLRPMMPINEKLAFAERLHIALKRGAKNVTTAADLATKFNLRHQNEPISTQAAQKWLTGKAYPTADKIETLANWLNVSPHWLRYGPAPQPRQQQITSPVRQNESQANTCDALTEQESKLLNRLRQLSDHQLFLISELVDQLAVEREMWSISDQA